MSSTPREGGEPDMTMDELGPMPKPKTEPRESSPGGADAVTEELDIPIVADLDPDLPPSPAPPRVLRPRADGGD